MRRARQQLRPNTFPFMAVLLCAMGSLILLLLVLDRRAKLVSLAKARAAQSVVDQQAQDTTQAKAEREAELRRRQEELHAYLLAQEQQLLAELNQVQAKKVDADAKIAAGQGKHADLLALLLAEQHRLDQAKGELQQRQKALTGAQEKTGKAQKELAQLAAELAELELALTNLQKLRAQQKQCFSVIPYKGNRGDNRQPHYLECISGGVVFHPDRVALTGYKFSPMALHEELDRRIKARAQDMPASEQGKRPYLFVLIRPDGLGSYYALNSALAGLKVDIGYELIDQDWVLDFSDGKVPPAPEQIAAAALPAAGSGKTVQGFQGSGHDILNGPPTEGSGPGGSGSGGWPGGAPAQGVGPPGQSGGAPGAGGVPGQGSTVAGAGKYPPGTATGPGGGTWSPDGGASGNGKGQWLPGAVALGPGAPQQNGVPGNGGPAGNGKSGTGGPAGNGAMGNGAGSPGTGPAGSGSNGNGAALGNASSDAAVPDANVKFVPAGNGKTSVPPGATPGFVPIGPGPVGAQGASAGSGTQGGNPGTGTQGGGGSGTPGSKAGTSGAGVGNGNSTGAAPGSAPGGNNARGGAGVGGQDGGSGSAQGQPGEGYAGGGGSSSAGGGGEPGLPSADAPLIIAPPQKKTPVKAAVIPGKVVSNRDWTIPLTCGPQGATLLLTQQEYSLKDLQTTYPGEHPLQKAVRELVARKQALVRPGEPPYRPIIRFDVPPDGLRCYWAASAVLADLHLPVIRHNVNPYEPKLEDYYRK